ncbi:MAG: hypothetical protein IJ849_09515 [Selenomonadaceae bacterium]|nr:hypothetical protein [Selenomonadaceae bacterium]
MAAKQKINHTEMTVLVFALRYAVGRRTYAPALVCDFLKDRLSDMTDDQKQSLAAELDLMLKYGYCIDDLSEGAVNGLYEALRREYVR